jgi:hypothetical protein
MAAIHTLREEATADCVASAHTVLSTPKGSSMIEQRFGIEIFPQEGPGEDEARRAAAYRLDVRAELAKILRSQTGRALASSLAFHKSTILVMPFVPNEGDNPCNAQEDGVTRGSDHSAVMFSPRALRQSTCAGNKRGNNNASLPHERLFHELVHSLRRISRPGGPLKRHIPLDAYKNVEEFLAVLTTNIFIADPTNPEKNGLRRNYVDRQDIEKELAGSYLFFRNGTRIFRVIEQFCFDNRGFTRMLARVRGPFNPIRAIYQNRTKAFEMAAAGDSEAAFRTFVEPTSFYPNDSGNWVKVTPFAGPPAAKPKPRPGTN